MEVQDQDSWRGTATLSLPKMVVKDHVRPVRPTLRDDIPPPDGPSDGLPELPAHLEVNALPELAPMSTRTPANGANAPG